MLNKTIFILPFAFSAMMVQPEIPLKELELEARGPVEIIEILPAVVTAYTSSRDETDADPFTTASGERAGLGIVACPARYEFGTAVEINGEEYICDDRMHKRFREQDRFDIWVETKAEAKEWGIKKLEVEIKTTI